jgi:hypothetical protein
MSIHNHDPLSIYSASNEELPEATEEEPPSPDLGTLLAKIEQIEQLWSVYARARQSPAPAIRPEDRMAADPSILLGIKGQLYQAYQELQGLDRHRTNELVNDELSFFDNHFHNITKYSPFNEATSGHSEYPEV